jgi:predicted  nucleic acid-binding Zn-ribbon protein
MEPNPDLPLADSVDSDPQNKSLEVAHNQKPEVQDANWLRMDPDLTRLVREKTEQELLGGLAALMRNKVEHEQLNRRLAQTHQEIDQARQEFHSVGEQVRYAEDELANRIGEKERIQGEITQARQHLEELHGDRERANQVIADLKEQSDDMQQRIDRFAAEFSASNEAAQTVRNELAAVRNEELQLIGTLEQLRQEIGLHHRELEAARNDVETRNEDRQRLASQLEDLRTEKTSLLARVQPLRDELDEKIGARETLVQHFAVLHGELERLAAQKTEIENDLNTLATNRAAASAELDELRSQHVVLTAGLSDLTKATVNPVPAPAVAQTNPKLPLLFSREPGAISNQWDSYRLESEFYTDESLDARKVADLLLKLPGLSGSLILKNKGAVLASNLPERLHEHLEVPDRDYEHLFATLPDSVQHYEFPEARLATYSLKQESLTVAQSGHAFLVVSHPHQRLLPGIPEKLATVAAEVAKMYPL